MKDIRKERKNPKRDPLPVGWDDFPISEMSRRRFLSLLSASTALALGASCSTIDRGSIVPYTKRPGEVIPGVPACYASTFQEGGIVQGVLVKTREGRPILVEGNPDHPVSRGTVGLRAMGDLLGLYDPDRLRAPSWKGAVSSWDKAEQALLDIFMQGKPVLLLTGAVVSPAKTALIDDLKRAFPGLDHCCWEPCTAYSKPAASFFLYGDSLTPKLHLDRADVLVSLQADFLGGDGNASLMTGDFARRRRITASSERMNRLWAIEGTMTLTGANADSRLQVRPSGIAALTFALVRLLDEVHGIPLPAGLNRESLTAFEPVRIAESLGVELSMLKLLAADLAGARKAALVLAGPSLPEEAHVACGLLNSMVEAEENTVDSEGGMRVRDPLSYPEFRELLEETALGRFSAGIFWDTNPAYSFPDASLWKKAISKMPVSFRIGMYEDETALDCGWRLPEHHWLESWGDFESASDYVSLRQPVIGPLHDTRQGEDLLLSCLRRAGKAGAPKSAAPKSAAPESAALRADPRSYSEYLKEYWRAHAYPAGSPVDFDTYWNAALHDGGASRIPEPQTREPLERNTVEAALEAAAKISAAGAPDRMELVLSPGAGIYDGRYANNGWLNELPDPVSKATWENPIFLSASDAARMSLGDGDVVEISSGTSIVEAPVMVQPGQCPGVAGLALGYGRRTGNVAAGIGSNAFPLMDASPGSPFLIRAIGLRRKAGGERRPVPVTQPYNRMQGRDLARSLTLAEYVSREKEDKTAGIRHHASLIPEREFPGHKWGMTVDLAACTGCGACVIACQAENNIAVVGPERILRGRHMHWIRIDRYYEGDLRNPRVLHQPMFCQQCDNAPCEIVCPVNATTHSPDGLNQMAYNRCVGTRYCSNNCPFKVRRFNFFDYTSMKKEPESLVFNPEVTVRPRGVMEKCTFCIQRIQDARQRAKIEGRPVRDGDICPACAAACPAGAIVFGDLNDPVSRVAKLSKTDRSYRMLEELGIRPSVAYLEDISNPAAGPINGPAEGPMEEGKAKA